MERLEKQKIMANLIGQLTVESRAGEVRKMERPQGSGPDDPPVTKEELETLRKHGIRSSGGNFLLKRYGPVFNPVRESEEFAGNMEQYAQLRAGQRGVGQARPADGPGRLQRGDAGWL